MPGKFRFSRRSEKNLEGVKPQLVAVVRRALELTEVDFGITEGLRTKERQKQLVAEGKSQTMNSRQTVRGYIRECLQWMIDDGVVSRIDLDIRRTGINELGNSITLWRRDGPVMISFDNLWSAITHGGQ